MLGIDVSYSANLITPDVAKTLREEQGIQILTCCLWTGAESPVGVEQALKNFREAGGITSGYITVHDYRPVEAHINNALIAAGSEWENLNFVAIDVENIQEVETLLGYTVSMDTIVQAAQIITMHGQRPVLYSNAPSWYKVKDKASLRDIPLWYANWNSRQEIVIPAWWEGTNIIGHQYLGERYLLANVQLRVDYNVFDDNFVALKVEPPSIELPKVPNDVQIVTSGPVDATITPIGPQTLIDCIHWLYADIHEAALRIDNLLALEKLQNAEQTLNKLKQLVGL